MAGAWLPTASACSTTMSSSLVGSLLQNSLGMNMACRSLGGVAFKIDAVEIGQVWTTGERLCCTIERRFPSPRRTLFSTRACGNNLFSGKGSARQDAGTQWQGRSATDGSYNSRASGVCSATTSVQGVSTSKVPLVFHNSFAS